MTELIRDGDSRGQPGSGGTRTLPLWAGRSFALIAVVLLALNLRTAVAALSPIVRLIDHDIPLDSAGLGLIGMLPPVAFAASALLAPMFAKRLGLERFVVIAVCAAVLGHLFRALSGSFAALFASTLLVFIGMGIGNVLLPPLVKRYFPDRIGVVTSLYATVMAVGMAAPALVAFPLADELGWRLSLGVWSGLALLSLLPWIGIMLRSRASRAVVTDEEPVIIEPSVVFARHVWHSRTAWLIAVIFGVVSFHVYTMFAWLPEMLIDTAAQTPLAAGALLALYSAIGFPLAIVVPMLAVRLNNVSLLIYAGCTTLVLGYLGLILMPAAAPWLWVALIRLGSLMFPLCLVLINLRSRTPHGSAVLSGFVQGIGYTLAAIGPLLVGLLHGLLGGWLGSYLVLLSTVLAAIVAGILLRKPAYIEDELAGSTRASSAALW